MMILKAAFVVCCALFAVFYFALSFRLAFKGEPITEWALFFWVAYVSAMGAVVGSTLLGWW